MKDDFLKITRLFVKVGEWEPTWVQISLIKTTKSSWFTCIWVFHILMLIPWAPWRTLRSLFLCLVVVIDQKLLPLLFLLTSMYQMRGSAIVADCVSRGHSPLRIPVSQHGSMDATQHFTPHASLHVQWTAWRLNKVLFSFLADCSDSLLSLGFVY